MNLQQAKVASVSELRREGWSEAAIYTRSLWCKYNLTETEVKYGLDRLQGNEETCIDVARIILPKDKLRLLLLDGKKETKELRAEFNLVPVDEFDAKYDALLAAL